MNNTLAQVATMNGDQSPIPQVEVVTITPELAQEWLSANTHNRKPKWAKIRIYAAAILRGEWLLNGDAIRFDWNDVLMDGQNRLRAIIEADQAIESFVIRGMPTEAQDTMDQGARRLFADSLHILGETDVTMLSSITRWTYRYEQYVQKGVEVGQRRAADAPSTKQLLEYFTLHKSRLYVALKEGSSAGRRMNTLSRSISAAAWFIFHNIDGEDCSDFFYKLSLGASLEEDNPIFVLRRWLNNNHHDRDKARGEVVFAVVIKAWNLYREGTGVKNLRWVGGGATPMRFPIAK